MAGWHEEGLKVEEEVWAQVGNHMTEDDHPRTRLATDYERS